MGTLLDRIDSPQDLKGLTEDELDRLAQEIRTLLIRFCRRYGGHLGSNLAVVEATIAIHRVFDLPHDHLVFDVSHQAYTHKILTGRRLAFSDPEHFGKVSGFTSPKESAYDDFVLGHTGTSISLACGLARTRDLTGGTGNVIALIGDGALSSGPAFEGLDWAAEQGGNLIIVVNDNEMSIAENHGGLYRTLAGLRETGGRSDQNPFRDLGLDYRYVEEGNSIEPLVRTFAEVKDTDHPVVVHIHTRKGLGLGQGRGEETGTGSGEPTLPALPAEGRVEANHWQNGIASNGKAPNSRKVYGRMAMQALQSRFPQEPGLVVISPATPLSNGIDPDFRRLAGRHYMDVGIAESHAVAFAAGLAKAGGTPVVATSSTFFQRAYDQIEQEMAINGSAVTLLTFSNGLSGTDATHSGVSDIAMMNSIPGLTCLAPGNGADFLQMLAWATGPARRPVVIRVPGERTLASERAAGLPDTMESRIAGGSRINLDSGSAVGSTTAPQSQPASLSSLSDASPDQTDPWESYRIVRKGRTVALLGLGDMLPLAFQAADSLQAQAGINATVVDPRQYSHPDKDTLETLGKDHSLIVTMEDGQLPGGWGQGIAAFFGSDSTRVLTFGADKEFNDRVPLTDLSQRYRLRTEDMTTAILSALEGKN